MATLMGKRENAKCRLHSRCVPCSLSLSLYIYIYIYIYIYLYLYIYIHEAAWRR